jgi:dTDP-L-rhamnose 4-epimerase
MHVLVTGGAGFIGSHLVDALVDAGHRVRVLDCLEPQVHGGRAPAYLHPKAEYRWGDVRDRAALRPALAGVEVVFHKAALVGVGQSMYEIERYVAGNVQATAVLLETLVADKLPLKKLIVASSMSIYGEGAYRCAGCGPVHPSFRPDDQLRARRWEMDCPRCGQPAQPVGTSEDKPLAPTSVYAVSKRDQEELCLAVGRSYHLPTVALRYFNVYGTRQSLSNPYTGACAIFSSRIKHRHAPLIFEDGRQSRDFVHVSDIVRANLLVMQEPRADYGAFNVGTGRATTILEVASTLATLYGVPVQPELTHKFRAGDIRHCVADVGRLRALGFVPKTALEDGLRELVAWGRQTDAEDRVEHAARELERRGLTQG